MDLIVIGAGLAGLTAAAEVKAAGRQVLVLEARDRAGGRIRTDKLAGRPIDLGAQVLHGYIGNPLTRIAKHQGVNTSVVEYDDVRFFGASGEPMDGEEFEKRRRVFLDALLRVRKRALDAKNPISMADALHADGIEQAFADRPGLYEWFLGSEAVWAGREMEGVAARYHGGESEYPGGNALLLNGYEKVLDEFTSRLDPSEILLSHRALKIEWHAPEARVTTDRGVFTAERALVTIPLGVLQTGEPTFDPALPKRKADAIRNLGSGTMNLVALEFSARFWPDEHDFLGIEPGGGPFVRYANRHRAAGTPILVAIAAGVRAEALEKVPDEEAVSQAMEPLRRTFGSAVTEPVAFKVTRWASDPFSRGSYSYLPPGASPKDQELLAEPLEKRLYFAGEATNKDHPASAHGAYLSGLREAKRILAEISQRQLHSETT